MHCKRHFHISPLVKRADIHKLLLRRQMAKERRAARIQELERKKAAGYTEKIGGLNRMQLKEQKKANVVYMNPEAKLVPTDELETKHLLFSDGHVGEVLSFPIDISTKLHALGMFNKKQGFQYLKRPVSMIRSSTGLVARELFAPELSGFGTKDRRVLVTGKGGSGKSFILLQMAAMALMKNYVVIAVPRGMDLVDNRTAFTVDEKSHRYKQNAYMSNLLARTRKACSEALRNQTISRRIRIGRNVLPEGAPLESILEDGELHSGSSHEAAEVFLLEMSRSGRPPMMFLFDNINAISVPSQIRSPTPPHEFVHPHRLWIPFFFTCLLNGTLNHPNAAIVAATSQHPHSPTLDIALGHATQKPYEPIDRRIPHSVDGVTVIQAGDQLTPEEAMGLSTFYKNAGLLKTIDRFDGVSKSVGDEDYHNPESWFLLWNNTDGEKPAVTKQPFAWRRRGRMRAQIVASYVNRGGIVVKEDPTDLEATMQRLALAGGTARGFWKACTRMSHY